MSWPSAEPPHRTWRLEVFQDAARIWGVERPGLRDLAGAFLKDAGMAAAMLFRLSSRLARHGHLLSSSLISRVNLALHGCQIASSARIGPGLRMPHPAGIVVGGGVQAGGDLTLYQNVTLGARGREEPLYPMIGDQVTIFPSCLVLGGIRIGDGACLGAGSVVLHEVAPGAVVAGSPAVPLDPRGGSAEANATK